MFRPVSPDSSGKPFGDIKVLGISLPENAAAYLTERRGVFKKRRGVSSCSPRR